MSDQELMMKAYVESTDPDETLRCQLEDVLRLEKTAVRNENQAEGQLPMNIFLCGYAGAGNTGADIRVHEILRQFRHFWGENANFRLLAHDQKLCGFFNEMAEIRELGYLPVFLPEMVEWADMSIACEGSLFKSSFGDILSLPMLASLAFSKTAGKLPIAYGSEAGNMSPGLQAFIKEFCGDATVFCRNEESIEQLNEIGLEALPGADTAWSFDPENSDWAKQQLKQSGWEEGQPIITVCPVNPYWWPVRADSVRYEAFLKDGSHADYHYGFMYFHAESDEKARQFESYVQALSEAVEKWSKTINAHIMIIAMDRVDRAACEAVSEKLSCKHSFFKRPDFSPDEIVSVLRLSSMLISSRFHSFVCSMSAGVPSIGLAYDERVRNVLKASGQERFVLSVENGVSSEELYKTMEILWEEREPISHQLKEFSAQQLLAQGEMGRRLCEVVQSRYPHLPVKITSQDPVDYLPLLSGELQELLNSYGELARTTTPAES